MFKRKIYNQLLNWKKESDGRSALMIYTKDAVKDQDIFCLPVYMSPFL